VLRRLANHTRNEEQHTLRMPPLDCLVAAPTQPCAYWRNADSHRGWPCRLMHSKPM
jgi:hypothetical protein